MSGSELNEVTHARTHIYPHAWTQMPTTHIRIRLRAWGHDRNTRCKTQHAVLGYRHLFTFCPQIGVISSVLLQFLSSGIIAKILALHSAEFNHCLFLYLYDTMSDAISCYCQISYLGSPNIRRVGRWGLSCVSAFCYFFLTCTLKYEKIANRWNEK